jgi:hypothetical protein
MSTTYEEIQEKNGDVYHYKIEKTEDKSKWVLHHKEDMPAVVKNHGDIQEFWVDGVLIKTVIGGCETWFDTDKNTHRDGDLPAFICDRYQEWYTHGKLNRDGDLPAFICDRYQKWYTHGKLHRDGDLPAIVCINGYKEWYTHGTLIKTENPNNNEKMPGLYWDGKSTCVIL